MSSHDLQYEPIFSNLDRFIHPLSNSSLDLSIHSSQTAQKQQSSYEQYLKNQLLSIQKNKTNTKLDFPQNRNHTKVFSTQENSSHSLNININNIRAQHSFKTIKVPNIIDDFYLNVLDWSCNNLLAIGLKRSLYCWSACSQRAKILFKQPKFTEICSVKFNNNNKLAVGNNDGLIKIYDIQKQKQCNSLYGHLGRVSSLDWYGNCLVSGSRDGYILKWDSRTNLVQNAYKAHQQQISGIKWNNNGTLIASGGNDNKLVIHETRTNTQLIKFSQHRAAIKALNWCPENSSIIAAGGGTNDKNIRYFNIKTLSHQYSIETGSQICNLLFSKISSEMITTHGYSLNQINIWNSNNLWKNKQSVFHKGIMLDHTARVLYMAESPSGDTIVTAAGDKTLRFWHPFQNSKQGVRKLEILELR